MNVGTKVAVLRNKSNISRNKLSRVFGITIEELLNDDIDYMA